MLIKQRARPGKVSIPDFQHAADKSSSPLFDLHIRIRFVGLRIGQTSDFPGQGGQYGAGLANYFIEKE